MNIQINGQPQAAPLGATVASLIDALQVNPKNVAVERNFTIVPRSQYGEVALAEGDQLEIVQFIGGG